MDSALVVHRLHFAFTITYHYLFPQLTMGLAPLIVIFKTLSLWKQDERYNKAARFWGKIFAINFLFGVITGFLANSFLSPKKSDVPATPPANDELSAKLDALIEQVGVLSERLDRVAGP